jgi:DNA polymerase/3'-5' exonuclease PolX
MPLGMRVQDGALWRDQEVVSTPEESDFFNAIGLAWVPPTARSSWQEDAHAL